MTDDPRAGRYRAAFESAFDAMVIADDDGVYLDANPSACELFGLERDALLGRRIDEFAPDDYDFEAAWASFQAAERERATFPLVRPDGERRLVEYAATADIVPGEHLSVLRDVSGRLEREEELRRQNRRLEQFASIVSHDLRNPLNVAQGQLELARAERDDDHLEAVARAHDRMAELVDDLLALARAGESVGTVEPVDLAAVAEASWAAVETPDARLAVETDQRVRADESRLRQLFENLFRNAVAHGGPDVTVTVGRLDDGPGFYVADDGPGFPAAVREGPPGAADAGLGLAIVRQIAAAHGWDVTLTAGAAGGARIEVRGVEPVDR
ncbi:MAG: sensor histidine kinase [Halobacteriales archaeon]